MSQAKSTLYALLVGFAVFASSAARADDIAIEGDRVTLAMILPALAGSTLGALDVGPSPMPGQSSVIRASDVRAKLKEGGHDARGLAIPKRVRLVRRAKKLEEAELAERVMAALAPSVAPCDIEQLSSLPALTIAAGDFELEAEALARKATGRTNVVVVLRQGERVQRISAQAVLTCPEPVIMPGARVRLVVNVGAVHVSAPGVAHQPGRVGDEIRVTNQLTKKSLMARVLDGNSVEVLR